jgi:two-component system sensor kinase FixL
MGAASIDRLLLVEDDPGFARLLREMFKEQGSSETEVTHVDCMADAEAYLAGHDVDIVLLDPGLPDSQSIDSVQRALAAAPNVPLVILTGRDDESLAVQALQAGAQDYLIKGQIDTRGLMRFLRYAVERNAMEATLFAERERAQVTLNSIGDAVACADISGRLTFLNLEAERLTGWSLEEADGRPLSDVIRIVDATSREILSSQIAMAAGREPTAHPRSNSVLIRRDGFETPIEDSVATIHDRDRNAAGAVIVFRDVSAARTSQQQLRAVSDELERSNRELQDFATIASHDLQEPLRKIQAFGDRLAERSAGALDEEASDYLGRMTNAAGRMQSLINDLLEYSQVTLRPEPPEQVELGVIVTEVLSDLDERIRMSGGSLTVGPLPTILANPLQMRQLFQNLIANALKFHPEGVAPQVSIAATARGGSRNAKGATDRRPVWEIRVRDNGIGFDEIHIERIFAPFQRLNGRQSFEGSGMGLAICRRIVSLLGGTITATSQPGVGTTFVIILPRTSFVVAAMVEVA